MIVNLLERPVMVPIPGFDADSKGPAVEFTSDQGETWLLAGINENALRKGEAWFHATDEGRRHIVSILRVLRRMVEREIDTGKWKRLHVVIPVQHVQCHEIARWYKFEVEGLMRAAGPEDEDCIMFARVS